MRRNSRKVAWLGIVAAAALALAGCSLSGGKKSEDTSSGGGSTNVADTPKLTIAMITHQSPGDTFWDLIRKGAQAAAAKDNVTLKYSADPDAPKQADLLQNAVDSKVDGIASTMPNTAALTPSIKKAVAAGIPVTMFNAGILDWQQTGALMYFGQDESIAGEASGKRLAQEGYKHVLCVIQSQGQVQLEARCDGVKKGLGGAEMTKLYVNGEDTSSVESDIQAKLSQDKGIDAVITLGAPIALAAVQSVQESGSSAKVVTFDTNAQLVKAIEAGDVQWAIDQQPYLQGYEAVDSLWLYINNANIIGGGQPVLTGPSFIDQSNIDKIATYAERGTR